MSEPEAPVRRSLVVRVRLFLAALVERLFSILIRQA
jgi:hypothetical protein